MIVAGRKSMPYLQARETNYVAVTKSNPLKAAGLARGWISERAGESRRETAGDSDVRTSTSEKFVEVTVSWPIDHP